MGRRIAFALREQGLTRKTSDRNLGLLLSIAYGFAAAFAVGLGVALGRANLLWHPEPTWQLSPIVASAMSLACGLVLAAFVVVATRVIMPRFGWSRDLVDKLSPFARALSERQIVWVAIMSSLGEELLFRGLFAPAAGIVASSLVFGVLHQVPGRARAPWLVWATGMGAIFGWMYQLTGSLVGPIIAHALINGANLHYLRSTPAVG
jgi:uncharacterized protein